MDKIINIVTEVTGVPAADIIAKRGNVETQEARMIFILIAHACGQSDYKICEYLKRSQVAIWKTRKYAEEYSGYNISFCKKYIHARMKCNLSIQ